MKTLMASITSTTLKVNICLNHQQKLLKVFFHQCINQELAQDHFELHEKFQTFQCIWEILCICRRLLKWFCCMVLFYLIWKLLIQECFPSLLYQSPQPFSVL